MKPLADCRLYAFIDSAYLHGRSPELLAEQLSRGGSDLVQLRAKELDTERVREIATRVCPILQKFGVGLVINDFPSVTNSVRADICHLGQEDFFDAGHNHRRDLPLASSIGVGLSSHSPEQAARAVATGADYVAIGPVYSTNTKPTARATGLDFVRWAANNVTIPWFAIGGINLGNLDRVIAAGARRVCVVSAILDAPDVAAACHEFKKRLASVPT